MIGDRDTDLEFGAGANLRTRGLRVRIHCTAGETWPAVVRQLT